MSERLTPDLVGEYEYRIYSAIRNFSIFNISRNTFLKPQILIDISMKKINLFCHLSIIFSFLFCSVSSAQNVNNVFQYSVLSALRSGNFEGDLSIRELINHGNFGLGTFNGMDGELILLNGEIYRASEKGEISSVSGDSFTPYAIVTNFKPDDSINIPNPYSTAELNKFLDSKLDTNFIYAVKIEGTFTYLKTRSIPLQLKPYKKMTEVLKTQPVFESENIKGTMVGYRFPAYINRVNQPGYHFHFITIEKNSGGHVLDLKTGNVKIEFARQNSLQISFPKNKYLMGLSPN